MLIFLSLLVTNGKLPIEYHATMKLTLREMQANEIAIIVDYFVDSDVEYLRGMGADKSKLPKREEWIEKLQNDIKKPHSKKEFYYLFWLLDGQPIGHSNLNNIEFGKIATMHLHVWDSKKRKAGLGVEFLKLTIPYYFRNFKLEKLICEPISTNVAPNKVLKKLGFDLVRTYDTVPGWINFHQTVNRYEMNKEDLVF